MSKFSIPLYSKLDIGRCLCNFWIFSENIQNYSALRHQTGEKEAQSYRSCRIMFNKWYNVYHINHKSFWILCMKHKDWSLKIFKLKNAQNSAKSRFFCARKMRKTAQSAKILRCEKTRKTAQNSAKCEIFAERKTAQNAQNFKFAAQNSAKSADFGRAKTAQNRAKKRQRHIPACG